MRVYDGLQRYELSARPGEHSAGEPVPARELARALRHAPRRALERVVDFLVAECGWSPTDVQRHDAALDRLVELIELGRVQALAFRPSSSDAGDVPDEDDVLPLSDLVAEEDEEVAAGMAVAEPMGIEPDSALEPPVGYEMQIDVTDPDIPAFDFEVG